MTDSLQLSRLVASVEDFAYALQALRDDVRPDARRDLTDITGAIGELWRLSTSLRLLRDAFEVVQYRDRLYRVKDDAELVCRSARWSLEVALGMVGRASEATLWMVWDDLGHRMRVVEGVPLLVRLRWYHNFIQGLLDQLEGYSFTENLARIKGGLQELEQQQQPRQQQQQRDLRPAAITYRVIDPSSNIQRQRITMPETPRSRPRRPPSDFSNPARSNAPPPPVPEAPMPQSPPVTWSSTRTYISSEDSHSRRTSYSSYDAASMHWASYIFGGDRWRSRYRASQQLEAATRCRGNPQVDAKLILDEDGFAPLTSVHFADNGSILTFYWRPHDGRARLLFTALNPRGQETHYCTPLTRLRAFRDHSILKLCMASSQNTSLFRTWAELKFVYHERMILFYSTFVALKRQDSTSLLEPLIEDPRDMQEELLFGGVIRDGAMAHDLRLLRDHGSRVLRLEARAHRGEMEEVPIWTAFLSKYRDEQDRDIFNLEGNGVVSMICPKPKPYVFVPEYGLPLMSNGDFALQFRERRDAAALIEVWTGLCNSGRS